MQLENSQIVQELGSSKFSRKKRALETLIRVSKSQNNICNYLTFIIEKIQKEDNYQLKMMCYFLLCSVPTTSFFEHEEETTFLKQTVLQDLKTEKRFFVLSQVLHFIGELLSENEFLPFFEGRLFPFITTQLQTSNSVVDEKLKLEYLKVIRKYVTQERITQLENFHLVVISCLKECKTRDSIVMLLEITTDIVFNPRRTSLLHQTSFPIFISEESFQRLAIYSMEYELLLRKINSLELEDRNVGCYLLTFMLVFAKKRVDSDSFVKETLIPLLEEAFQVQNVITAGYCLFILAYRDVISAAYYRRIVSKYLFITTSSSPSKDQLEDFSGLSVKQTFLKEVCVLLNFVNDKYPICLGMFSQLKALKGKSSSQTRVFVLSVIFRALVHDSVKIRVKQILNQENYVVQQDEFLNPVIFLKSSHSSQFKNEVVYALVREFLSRSPLSSCLEEESDHNEKDLKLEYKAWFLVGISILKLCRECFNWDQNMYQSGISQVGALLYLMLKCCTKLFGDEFTDILKDYVKEVLKDFSTDINNVYAKFILLFILSFNISFSFQTLSGEDSKDIIVKSIFRFCDFLLHARGYGLKKVFQVQVLNECLLTIAKLIPTRAKKFLDSIQEILTKIEKSGEGTGEIEKRDEMYNIYLFSFKKLNFLQKYDSVNFLPQDHPTVFESSSYTKYDHVFLKQYMESYFEMQKLRYNLSDIQKKSYKKIELPISIKRKTEKEYTFGKPWKVISFPGDPFLVSVKYKIVSLELHAIFKIENISKISFHSFYVVLLSNDIHFCGSGGNKRKIKSLKPEESKEIVVKYRFFEFKEVELSVRIVVRNKFSVRTKPLYIYINKLFSKLNFSTSIDQPDFLFMLKICKFKTSVNVLFERKRDFKNLIKNMREKFVIVVGKDEEDIQDCEVKNGMLKLCLLTQCSVPPPKNGAYVLVSVLIEKYYEKGDIYHYVANFEFLSADKNILNEIKESKWLQEKVFRKYRILRKNDNLRNVFSNSTIADKIDINEHYGWDVNNRNMLDVFVKRKYQKLNE